MGLPVWRCPSPPVDEIKDAQKPSRSPIRRTNPTRRTPRRHVSVFPGGRRARGGLEHLQEMVDAGQITDPNLVSAIARNTAMAAYHNSTIDAAPRTTINSRLWLPEEDSLPPAGSRFAASPLQMHDELESDLSSSSDDMPLASHALLPPVRQDRSHLRLPSDRHRAAESGNHNLREIYLRQALERRGTRSTDVPSRDGTRNPTLYSELSRPTWQSRRSAARPSHGADALHNPAVRSGTPRAILDRPIPSTFSDVTQPSADRPTIDGLGDRSRSPPPPRSPIYSPGSPGWAQWDPMLQTITPDEHLPTPDSSFTSAAASASFSASRSQSATSTSTSNALSAASSRTSLATDTSQEAALNALHNDDSTCDTDGENPNPSTRRANDLVNDYPRIIQTADVADGPPLSTMSRSDRYFENARWFMRRAEILERRRDNYPRLPPSRRRDRPMDRPLTLADIPDDGEVPVPGQYPTSSDSHLFRTLPIQDDDDYEEDDPPIWSRRNFRFPHDILDAENTVRRTTSTSANVPDGPILPQPSSNGELADSTPVVIDAAGNLTGSDLDSLRPIMERLASRGDIPEEWWQSVGLTPVFARGLERSRARAQGGGPLANL